MSNKGFTFGYKSNLNIFESENSYNYPGPGSYNLNESYESLYKPTEKTIGKGMRFQHDDIKEKTLLAPGIYNPKTPQITLPNITFTNSQRTSINLMKNAYNIGPGSYNIDKFHSLKNNALPFINAENEELIRIIHDVSTPGPGTYDWGKSPNNGVSLVNYSMNSSKIPNKTKEIFPAPGPGEYDLKNPLKSKSISFVKANKNFQLDSREYNPDVAPNTYDIQPQCYDNLSKNNKQITYSFSASKRMPSKHYFPNFEHANESSPIEEKNKKGIVFSKAERKVCRDNSDEKTTPGPGIYENKDSWENLQKTTNAKTKMKEMIEKLQAKSKEKPKETRSNSIRKTSLSKKLRPMMRMLTKNDFTSALLRREENNLKKNSANNPLKSYILKKIQKNVEKILENKLNKEIFILSNEAEKKRRNKGFTTSTRKYEFLLVNGQQSPGPNKYEIKRELNLMTLPIRKSKKIMIFDVMNDGPAPNSYNIESPTDKKNEKNKSLMSSLRKIEEINKWKKVKKEELINKKKS